MDTNALITMDNSGQQWITMDNNGQQNGQQNGQNLRKMDNNGQQSAVLHASLMPLLCVRTPPFKYQMCSSR